jgi:hypothetical protein
LKLTVILAILSKTLEGLARNDSLDRVIAFTEIVIPCERRNF